MKKTPRATEPDTMPGMFLLSLFTAGPINATRPTCTQSPYQEEIYKTTRVSDKLFVDWQHVIICREWYGTYKETGKNEASVQAIGQSSIVWKTVDEIACSNKGLDDE